MKAAHIASRVYEFFGHIAPGVVYSWYWLLLSLSQPGRFGAAARYEDAAA